MHSLIHYLLFHLIWKAHKVSIMWIIKQAQKHSTLSKFKARALYCKRKAEHVH